MNFFKIINLIIITILQRPRPRPINKMDNNEEIDKLIELPIESISNIATYFTNDENLAKNIVKFITMYQGPIEDQII